MQISVIIPTRNRSALLDKALESITRQTLGQENFEVLVIDNASTDNTKQIADKYAGRLPLTYIYEQSPGLHNGRHHGYKASKSELLLYSDDDIIAFPTWLKTMVDLFDSDPSIAIAGGKNLPDFESEPPDWLRQSWQNIGKDGQIICDLSILDLGDEVKEVSPYFIFGCNFGIRKKILTECKGFHPDGMPFELIKYRGDGESYISHFVKSNGYKAIYHPGASVYHFVPTDRMTLEYFKKRKYMQGISDAYTFLRAQKELPFLVSLKRQVKRMAKSIFVSNKKVSNNNIAEEPGDEMYMSYKAGYNYLVNCYQQEKNIKHWVHKEHYL
jgi:glycosyltransferase involved in cell wall biosynthesis